MPWYATIDKPSDRVILHLKDLPTHGETDQTRLTTPDSVTGFLTAHPEIEAVNVYSGDFPRGAVPRERFDGKMVKRLFRHEKTGAPT